MSDDWRKRLLASPAFNSWMRMACLVVVVVVLVARLMLQMGLLPVISTIIGIFQASDPGSAGGAVVVSSEQDRIVLSLGLDFAILAALIGLGWGRTSRDRTEKGDSEEVERDDRETGAD